MYMCVCIYGYVEIECRVAEYLLSVTLCVCVCVPCDHSNVPPPLFSYQTWFSTNIHFNLPKFSRSTTG